MVPWARPNDGRHPGDLFGGRAFSGLLGFVASKNLIEELPSDRSLIESKEDQPWFSNPNL